MAFSSGSSSLNASPNITPLIDVLLVLLIIFMLIVPVTPRGLESLLPQPSSSPSKPDEPRPIIVHVYARGSAHHVGYRLANKDLQPAELPRALSQLYARSERAAVFIDGDPSLDFQAVATTVAAAKTAGFQSIGLLPRAPHH